jgi:DNA-binding LacI/PurR family transcriptional regulator/anti-anti-sigma regulatory factor
MPTNYKTYQKYSSSAHSRPTIGYLVSEIQRDFALLPWLGMMDAARQHDVNLITFIAGVLRPLSGYWGQANVLCDLAGAECLNGLIIWPPVMGVYLTEPEIEAFCRRYASSIPVVLLEEEIIDIPRVTLEDYQGFRLVVDHLIEVHSYQRIAFAGMYQTHAGFQARYRAYTESMAAHGLPVEEKLAQPWFPDEFIYPSGRIHEEVLEHWLKEALAEKPEAIAGVCDTIALQVLEILQAQDIRIPDDVAVVGFDDFRQSQVVIPPLTTSNPSFYKLGYQAVETLLARLGGKTVPEQVTVPPQLMVRQSCGCMDPAVVQVVTEPAQRLSPSDSLVTMFNQQQSKIVEEMLQAMGAYTMEGIQAQLEQLLDKFVAEITGQANDVFLRQLDEILRQVITANSDVAVWQGAITVLRRYALPYLDNDEAGSRAEDLWQQTRIMIGGLAERVQMYRHFIAEQQANKLREVGYTLINTFDVNELMDVLTEGLPQLDIPSCYLCLYENPQPYQYPDPAPEWARLILAYSDMEHPKRGVNLESGGQRFPSRQLIPPEIWPQDKAYSFVVEPLYFQENQIGFVLFEVGPRDGSIYEALRGEISSALQGALLLRAREEVEAALEQAYAEVEQQVAERTAELQREIAERERLQQEVIEAQQRAIQELSTPIIPVLEGVIILPLIGSIDSLRARDITRALLGGIGRHGARVVILDVTGVPLVDSGVANHLNKTVQAARLKGARTIVTGISEAVAETIVDLGIDWSRIETMSDLQTGLRAVLTGLKRKERGTTQIRQGDT